MKDIKKFLIAALSFMLLVSVSCSNDDKTGGGGKGGKEDSGGSGEETIYNVVGTWFIDDSSNEYHNKDMIQIKEDGSATYYGSIFPNQQDLNILSKDVTKNGNTYTVKIGNDTATLTFTSDTTGKSDYQGTTTLISKRQ